MFLAATSDLPIDIDEVPLAEVEPAWHRAAAVGGSSSGPEHRAAIQKALWSLRAAIRHEPEQTHGARHER